MVSRRIFCAGASAFLGAAALAPFTSVPVWSQTSLISAGDTRIDVLSDGQLRLPASMVFDGLSPSDTDPILNKYGVNKETLEPDCNLTLYRDGKNTILFDVGSGANFMATAGQLQEGLAALGVDPADVTHVIFTHAHPDHLWGVFDDFDDPLFPNARHMISRTEWDYWRDPDTVKTIGEARQSFAAAASRILNTLEDQFETFDFEKEIVRNVFSRDTSGHTPGHTAFEVMVGSEPVMVLGDCVANHHLAFERPGLPSGADQDRVKGAKTRVDLLAHLARTKTKLIGFHLPFPGIGQVDQFGDAYKFVAAS